MKHAVLKSYAKVNLFLKVGKKIKTKKLHNIQSLVFLINLSDKITIKRNYGSKDIVEFKGKFKKYIIKNNNSIIKSMRLLKKKNFLDNNINYRINVKKNIPVFSGLGGGSSNAASIIKFFLKKKDISKKNIDYFSKTLGSDFRLFLSHKKIFQKNILTINNFKTNYKFFFVMVYPFLKSSTKEIYSKISKFDIIRKKNNFYSTSKSGLIDKLRLEKNSLERIVIYKFPKIKKILKELEISKNCQFSRITGSGSACFGVFLNKKDANLALKQIKRKFPQFWSVLCKTI